MLNDNLLGNKLNSFKNKPEETHLPTTQALSGFVFILEGVLTLIKSFIFGFSFKAIFVTDWTFLGIMCVGFTFNYILNAFTALFKTK